ncbi:MAG: hypothetical protein WEC84_01105 [Candidatus Andersenbacteria bacterium]
MPTTVALPSAQATEDDTTIRIMLPEYLLGIPSHEVELSHWVEFTEECTREGRFFLCYFEWQRTRCAAVLRMGSAHKPAAHWHAVAEWPSEENRNCKCPERYIGGCSAERFFELLSQHTPHTDIGHAVGTAALSA